jgi:hypothetical protein
MYLLDTDTLIYFLKGQLSASGNTVDDFVAVHGVESGL